MNVFKKLYLKTMKPAEYSRDKHAKRDKKFLEAMQAVSTQQLIFETKPYYTFKHSGHLGDIIYALPSIFAMADTYGSTKAALYLGLNEPSPYKAKSGHSAGSVMLNDKLYQQLQPLLLNQKRIMACEPYCNQPIDCDMDLFRTYPIIHDKNDISRWYFQIFPAVYDLSKPWLEVEQSSVTQNAIVLSRSFRYRNPFIDYSFIKDYPNVFFVGVEEEYRDMQHAIPHLVWLEVNNFYELASHIAGSKLFIGNQSFAFSLAEALKTNRILEMFYDCPNVNITGGKGYQFSLQNRFEFIVKNYFTD